MAVTEEALAAVTSVSLELESVEERLQTLLSLLQCPSTLASLPPLHRSAAFLSLSKTLNALFALHLRCKGLPTEDHNLISEEERVSLYDSKVGHFIDDLKGPKHRSVSVNVEAANRIIEHAIPDLTEEQKKGLQGKRQCGEARKPRNLLHAPLQPDRTQSITEAAAAFLEEARKELLEEQKRNESGSG